jgi:hypothetical protein
MRRHTVTFAAQPLEPRGAEPGTDRFSSCTSRRGPHRGRAVRSRQISASTSGGTFRG